MATKSVKKNEVKEVVKGRKRVLTGKVVSDKMTDTIVVLVERYVKHPKYHKYMHIHKRFKAHDAGNKMKIGDTVRIEECAPISKDKSFTVIEKVASAKVAEVME